MSFRLNGLKSTRSNPGASRGAKPEIIIGAFEDLLQWPPRDENKVRMLGNMVFKPGDKHYRGYFTPSTQKRGFNSEAEEDNVSITPYFNGSIPGDELEQSEFIANWLGVNVFVMTKGCNDKHWKVMGTPCTPLQIVPSHEANKDKTGFDVEFKSYVKNDVLPGFYYGEITESEPYLITNGEAPGIFATNGTIYKTNPTALGPIAPGDNSGFSNGTRVTIIGQGGENPLFITNGLDNINGMAHFVLKDGIHWIALDGSTITFIVMNDGNTDYYIEESRS